MIGSNRFFRLGGFVFDLEIEGLACLDSCIFPKPIITDMELVEPLFYSC